MPEMEPEQNTDLQNPFYLDARVRWAEALRRDGEARLNAMMRSRAYRLGRGLAGMPRHPLWGVKTAVKALIAGKPAPIDRRGGVADFSDPKPRHGGASFHSINGKNRLRIFELCSR